MPKFVVYIQQVNQTFVEVNAKDEEEAREKGKAKWRKEEAWAQVMSVEKCREEYQAPMIYTVNVLASLLQRCLTDILATPAEILSLTRADGFATIAINCDAATAATIAERYHVSEI